MFIFAWPWIFCILPLPWFIYRFLPVARITHPALPLPSFDDILALCNTPSVSTNKLKTIFISLTWLLLVSAGARPQWIGDPDQIPVTGRDMIIAVDTSGSMKAEDMEVSEHQVNRLVAVKAVADEFIQSRQGDRIGLILFGTNAYLQSPLSFDTKTVNTLLQESQIGIAGEKTALGDAIGLAIKRMAGQEKKDLSQKVLILMTDGANTAGIIEPIKAAELASRIGLKIYTIGVGADSMVVNNLFGQQLINPSSDLDVTTLTKIAEITNGQFFRARDTQSLKGIYSLIDKLEPINADSRYLRPINELFFWPLLVAAITILISISFSLFAINFGSNRFKKPVTIQTHDIDK